MTLPPVTETAMPHPSDPETESDVADRLTVSEAVARMSLSIDRGDWSDARLCFAEDVVTDYASLTGAESAKVTADDLVLGWSDALSKLDAVQHLMGTPVVTVRGGRAECWVTGQVSHCFGGERWVIGGIYRYNLLRHGGAWLITHAAFKLQWEDGDRAVMTRAAKG